MAQESLQVDVDNGAASKKKKIIIIVVAAVLLLAIGGAAAWFFLSDDPEPAAQQQQAAPAKPELESMYVSLPRPFLFNLQSGSNSYLVQIKVQLQVRGVEAQEITRKHTPLLRDALLSTFSAADGEAIRSADGKDQLRARALLNVQTTMQSITGHPQVEKVLFTGFIMQ